MSIEVKVPDLGENVTEGEVVTVLVSEGDSLASDQAIIELETGKATVEVPTEVSGVVEKIHVSAGDKVAVGALILSLSGDDAPPQTPAREPPIEETPPPPEVPAPQSEPEPVSQAAAPSGPVEILLPGLGENVEEGEIVGLLVAEGDTIERDQPLMELETGKATVEVPSEVAGTLSKLHVAAGEKVKVGQLIALVESTGGPPPEPEAAPKPEIPAPPPATAPEAPAPAPTPAVKTGPNVPVKASPSVRKFAREIGVDLAQLPAAAQGQRITIDDVKARAKKLLTAGPGVPVAGAAAPPLPDFSKWGEISREPMSNIRKATADHMAACWSTIPHVTQHDQADITKLEKLRKKYANRAEAAGGKLTITAILVKIAASALRAFPQFNASIDMEGKEIVYKKYFHIGLAVDTPRGLVVPVIRDVDKKNIIDLSVEISEIASRAKDGKIGLDEMQGGSFTISNLGGIGGTYFTPIVNHPEVAILGVGRGSHQPVYIDGEFVPRLMMPLSLSYDHRLIDGADGARFLRWIVEAIYEPFFMTLEG